MAVERPFGVDHCVKQDGSDNSRLRSAFAASVGIANVWSVGVWYKPDANAFTIINRIWSIRDADAPDILALTLFGGSTNDPILMNMFDSAGVEFKNLRWDNLAVVNAWNFFMVTWNGTDLLLYRDGTLRTPTSTPTDDPGTMADSGRRIGFGVRPNSGAEQASGSLYALGVWSSVLTSGEQLVLAKGHGDTSLRVPDFDVNFRDYVSAANLQHYYRPGFAANIGTDYGVAASLMPLVAEGPARPLIVKDAPVTSPTRGEGFSVKLDGTDSTVLRSAFGTIGIANVWSVGIWYKPDANAFTITNQMWGVRDADAPDILLMQLLGAAANDPVGYLIRDSAGVILKDFRFDSVLSVNKWHFLMLTFDGAADESKLYLNGIERAPTTILTNISGTVVDSGRRIGLGVRPSASDQNASGRIYSLGFWDSVLTDAEQLALYNFGDGVRAVFDKDLGAYVSKAALQHYYRPGLADVGFDYGIAAVNAPLAVEGLRAVLVEDAPVGPP